MSRKYEFNDNYPEYDFNEDGKVTIEDVSNAPQFLLGYLSGDYEPKQSDSEIMAKFRDNSRKIIEEHVSGEITIHAVTDVLNLRHFLQEGIVQPISEDKVAKGKKIFVNQDYSNKYTISVNGGEPQPLACQVFVVDGEIDIQRKIADTYWEFNRLLSTSQSHQWSVNFTSNDESFSSINYVYDEQEDDVIMYFDDTVVYQESESPRWNTNYKSIHIISGKDIQDEGFIAFLDEDATAVTQK